METGQDKNRFTPPVKTLRETALIYSRRPEEVDDLVQDLLLETVRSGRDVTDEAYLPWARGFLRNRAAFIARTEGRRRKREKKVQPTEENPGNTRLQFPEVFITQLPPSLSLTARLINCGLNQKELEYLLDVSNTALRQRFTALRKKWQAYCGKHETVPDSKNESTSPFNNGLLRRALRNAFHGNSNKMVGSVDPDGHLFVIRSGSAHKSGTDGNNKVKKDG